MIAVPQGYTPGISPRRSCGVVAVAAATGLPFEVIWEYMKSKQPKSRRPRWAGATSEKLRFMALRHFGVKFDVQVFVGGTRAPTLTKFCEWHAKPGVLYMVKTFKHVTMVRDGIAMDQSGSSPVAEHRCARVIVKNIVTIR